jgi:Na+/H+-dicarboxylate symporter
VTRFVILPGATVTLNGTALYESVVVIFASQALGVDLSLARRR